MRIAYLSADFGVAVNGSSGSSIHVRQVTDALRVLGHDVRIFSTSRYEFDHSAPDGSVQIVQLDGFTGHAAAALEREALGQHEHVRREFRRLLFSEYLQRELLPELSDFDPHFIYERYSLFSYAGIELARRLTVPHILEVNAPLAQEAALHRDLVLTNTAAQLEERIWNGTHALLVVSESLRDKALKAGVPEDRISVVRTGVDCDLFTPSVPAEPVRTRLGLDCKKVVGFVGSLKPWHDLDTLLAAIRILVARDPEFRLLVIGRGPRVEEIASSNEAFIVYPGAVDHREVPAYTAAMDVVAIPYAGGQEHYFSPIKLFEAMAMARPIVGARIGQVANVIDHGKTGMLYEPGNAEALASTIEEIFALSDGSSSLGANARRSVEANYTWQHVAQQIIGVAQSLLAGVRV